MVSELGSLLWQTLNITKNVIFILIHMKKVSLFKNVSTQRLVVVAILTLLVCDPTFAAAGAGNGSTAINNAATSVQQYWGPVSGLIKVVGAVVGLLGGLRIYNKWTNGDQDVNKEILGWGGACLFLFLVPTFLSSFFGIS